MLVCNKLLADDTSHLAALVGVTPLVVVPREDFNEGGIELDATLCIEDRGVGIVAEVGRNDCVLSVAEDALEFALRSLFHSLADLLVGGRCIELYSEVNDGHVGSGDTHRHTSEFAVEFGENFAYSLGSTSGRGDDVLEDATTTTPVFLRRTVNGLLSSGSSVNGGHETTLDAELVVENLGDRSETVGGARSVGDDLLASVGVVVNTVDEHRGSVLRRCRHDDLLGTSLEVSACELLGQEETGRLDNNVNAEGAPSDVGGILLSEDLDLVAINDEVVTLYLDVMVELAVNGVVLQHVSEVVSIEQVVDAYNLNVVSEVLDSGAENHATDAAEAIDTKFNHFV